MKTDNYLSLCLEEAAKSPLHYRHGAIVVRGGKVIGRGHNDYRPGFNGGALKTGRIASGAELKKKLKGKQKCKQDNQQHQQHQQQSHGTFVPFENANPGGGHSVNQPLSMHSEMMAIYTALNASSTLSSTTFSREKPCFKLPRADKRKARLRRAVLEAYVKAVCDTSAGTGKVRLENKSNNKVKEDNNDNHNLATQTLADLSLAFHKDAGAQKHHQNRKTEKKNGKKNRYQYQYGYGRYRQAQQAQSASKDGKPSVSRFDECDVLREHSSMTDDDDGNNEGTISTTSSEKYHRARGRKDYKRVSAALFDVKTRMIADNTQSGKMKSSAASQNDQESTQPVLLPIGRAIKADDRKQHSRLQGADLYVVRIGWTGTSQIKPRKLKAARPLPPSPPANPDDTTEDLLLSSVDSLSSLSITSTKSATGSLHDELVNPEPSPSPSRAESAEHICSFDRDKIHASRPCYRCVAFMHKVGIRRVFWTNDAGTWEGDKVSALIDAMDSGMEDVANGGPTGNGVFVTKHEVLMLRRIMGAKAST